MGPVSQVQFYVFYKQAFLQLSDQAHKGSTVIIVPSDGWWNWWEYCLQGYRAGTILGDLLGEGCPRRGKVRGAGERVCDASWSQRRMLAVSGGLGTWLSCEASETFRKEGRKEGSSCAIQENNSGSKPAGRKARIYQEPVNFCEGSDSNYFRLCEPSGSVSTTYFHGGIKATVNSDDWTNVLVFQENFIYRNRRHPGLGHCAVVCQPLVFQ